MNVKVCLDCCGFVTMPWGNWLAIWDISTNRENRACTGGLVNDVDFRVWTDAIVTKCTLVLQSIKFYRWVRLAATECTGVDATVAGLQMIPLFSFCQDWECLFSVSSFSSGGNMRWSHQKQLELQCLKANMSAMWIKGDAIQTISRRIDCVNKNRL